MAGKTRSQGTKLYVSLDDADEVPRVSATMVQVKGVTTIGNPDGEAAEISTTDLDSEEDEFMMGLPSNGKFPANGHAIDDDPGQAALLDARASQELRWFERISSKGKVAYFKGVVTRASDLGVEVNGVTPFESTIRISGKITRV